MVSIRMWIILNFSLAYFSVDASAIKIRMHESAIGLPARAERVF